MNVHRRETHLENAVKRAVAARSAKQIEPRTFEQYADDVFHTMVPSEIKVEEMENI
jgi:hypothetical protein